MYTRRIDLITSLSILPILFQKFQVNTELINMTKPRVFVTRHDYPQVVYKLLNEKFDIDYWDATERNLSTEEFKEKVKGVFGLFCYPANKVDKEIIDAAGDSLKVVSTFSVGYEHIAIDILKKKNIRIGYTPEVLTEATAEHAIALLLAVSRRIVESYNAILCNEWTSLNPLWMLGQGLESATVGIIGAGRIGTSIAKKLKPFNIEQLLYYSRSRKIEVDGLGGELTSIDNLVKRSDFIIVSIACNNETKGIINKNRINSMKSNAILINIARGAIIDQEALLEALKQNKISGAGLDVTVPEPLPSNHPLLKLTNVVITPHIASGTYLTRHRMAGIASNNIIAVLENTKMLAEVL